MIALWRDRLYLRNGEVIKEEHEYSYYVTSLARGESTAEQLADLIRGHWDAVENGSHYRRDKTLGEDGSLIRDPNRSHVAATLRNLTVGLFELQKRRRKLKGFLPQWRRKMTGAKALALLKAEN